MLKTKLIFGQGGCPTPATTAAHKPQANHTLQRPASRARQRALMADSDGHKVSDPSRAGRQVSPAAAASHGGVCLPSGAGRNARSGDSAEPRCPARRRSCGPADCALRVRGRAGGPVNFLRWPPPQSGSMRGRAPKPKWTMESRTVESR